MENEVLRCIRTRRSVRAYRPDPIAPDTLRAIVEAGTWAASGHGWQPVKIVVLQNPTEIAELERMNAAALGNPDAHPFYGAPVVCVVLADPERYTCVQDEPRLLRRWAREGTVLQANKGSFFGMFGRRAAAAAHWALADGCLHLIASDAHSPYRRTTRMSDIFDFTADFAAEEIADFLLRQNPADILANRPVYTVREKF